MRLIIDDIECEIDKASDILLMIEQEVNTYLAEKQLYFSHFIIDEREWFSGYDDYLLHNKESIHTIEAVLLSAEEIKLNVLTDASDYLSHALPAIEQLGLDWGVKPSPKQWELLGQLIEAVDWVQSILQNLSNLQIEKSRDELLQLVSSIGHATEDQDYSLLIDLIMYELHPLMSNIHELIKVELRMSNREGTSL